MSAVFTGYKEGQSVETLLQNGPFFNSGHSYPLPQSNPPPPPPFPKYQCRVFHPQALRLLQTTLFTGWGIVLALRRIK